MVIDAKAVEKKTSQYMDSKGFGPKNFLVSLFLEENTFASFISGAVTAVTICLAFFNGTFWPFIVWVVVMALHSVIKTVYWASEIKKADQEIKRLDKELVQLNEEIKKRQTYFEGLSKKKDIS